MEWLLYFLEKPKSLENYILISHLNDFIFCPRSIYFHALYGKYNARYYKDAPQLRGEAAHNTVDKGTYSTRKEMLQGLEVYSEKYKLCGKIDVFNGKTGHLIERKRKIKAIYDGYIFQVYAQYFGLVEMGYEVKKITIHCLVHNKNYPVLLPTDNPKMLERFEILIHQINHYELNKAEFKPNPKKCSACIYANLCDFSPC